MSTVYNDIMDSLNELLDAALGKETGIVVHSRPDGAARRMPGLMWDHPDFAENMGIYI